MSKSVFFFLLLCIWRPMLNLMEYFLPAFSQPANPPPHHPSPRPPRSPHSVNIKSWRSLHAAWECSIWTLIVDWQFSELLQTPWLNIWNSVDIYSKDLQAWAFLSSLCLCFAMVVDICHCLVLGPCRPCNESTGQPRQIKCHIRLSEA